MYSSCAMIIICEPISTPLNRGASRWTNLYWFLMHFKFSTERERELNMACLISVFLINVRLHKCKRLMLNELSCFQVHSSNNMFARLANIQFFSLACSLVQSISLIMFTIQRNCWLFPRFKRKLMRWCTLRIYPVRFFS